MLVWTIRLSFSEPKPTIITLQIRLLSASTHSPGRRYKSTAITTSFPRQDPDSLTSSKKYTTGVTVAQMQELISSADVAAMEVKLVKLQPHFTMLVEAVVQRETLRRESAHTRGLSTKELLRSILAAVQETSSLLHSMVSTSLLLHPCIPSAALVLIYTRLALMPPTLCLWQAHARTRVDQ